MADVGDLIARLPRAGGYKALTAEDGVQAFAAVESGTPDLVLLDLTMPAMDGVEVLRRLWANRRWRRLPVVRLTGFREGYMVEEAVRLGVEDFVLKG